MKTPRWLVLFLAGMGVAALAIHGASEGRSPRARAHRIVIEVNVEGQDAWGGILTNVENLQKALGREHTQIELVAHGKGLGLLLATNTLLKERLQQASTSGVVLNACENTMRRKHVNKEDLFAFVTTVPSGVTEVVLKQEAGWAYLKGGG